MLEQDETTELIRSAQSGDECAKARLITENAPLIKSVIRRFKGRGIEYDDLYQLGCVGFLKAIKNFSFDFNVRFSTYAVPMILGEVKRYLRDDGYIKVSRTVKTEAAKINAFIASYRGENGKTPSVEEIAEKFGISKRTVANYIERLGLGDHVERVGQADFLDDYAVAAVADALGISYDQLLALNPGCDQPQNFISGQQLLVTKAVPVLSVQVTRTISYQQEIPYETETTNSSLYLQGTNKVTREGQNGLADVTARATYINGVEVSRTVISSTTVQEPVNEQVTVGTGTVDVSSGGSGSFIWPMSGYVSSEYGDSDGRSSNHRGMDIARYGGATGAPIYASAGGRVIYATYNSGGYGRLVKIDHGNGVQTWYAHCNTLLVSVGDVVAQGQQIATAGSTGNVTGPHLHFEVVVNGVKVNPRRYLP